MLTMKTRLQLAAMDIHIVRYDTDANQLISLALGSITANWAFEPPNLSFLWGNTVLLGSTRMSLPNGISRTCCAMLSCSVKLMTCSCVVWSSCWCSPHSVLWLSRLRSTDSRLFLSFYIDTCTDLQTHSQTDTLSLFIFLIRELIADDENVTIGFWTDLPEMASCRTNQNNGQNPSHP